MFAIDHAAAALLINRRFPSVPIAPLLVSVHAMELAWVTFNYLGIERTTTESTVRSVADVTRRTDAGGHLQAAPGLNHTGRWARSEEHTSELQSRSDLVCRLLLEKKKKYRSSSFLITITTDDMMSHFTITVYI